METCQLLAVAYTNCWQVLRMLHQASSGFVSPCCVHLLLLVLLLCLLPLLQTSRLSGLVARYKGSVLLEVQSRCCEFSKLLDAHADITPQVPLAGASELGLRVCARPRCGSSSSRCMAGYTAATVVLECMLPLVHGLY